jgi:hypothetical protein
VGDSEADGLRCDLEVVTKADARVFAAEGREGAAVEGERGHGRVIVALEHGELHSRMGCGKKLVQSADGSGQLRTRDDLDGSVRLHVGRMIARGDLRGRVSRLAPRRDGCS